jgi:hypothetical protein
MIPRFARIAVPRVVGHATRLPRPNSIPSFPRRFASHSTLPTINGPIKVTAPDLSAIRASEYFEPDTQLIKEDEAKLNLTEAAVQVGSVGMAAKVADRA